MHQHQTHTTPSYRYKDQGKPSQQKEYFVYDAIDRLTQVQLNDEISQQISYDQSGLGNITRKTGVTTTDDMIYGGAGTPPVGPYALTEIPAVSPDFSCSELQNVHYTNFDKVSFIEDGSKVLGIDYGYDLQRIKQTFTINNSLVEEKVFAGGLYEEITNASGNVRKLHYIPSPDGVFAIYVDDLTEGKKMHYILKDHLGSYNVIADEQGNKLEELSFDAWGTRRNSDWTTANVPTSFIFDRGFTSHEHLDEFGLINMNGRVYDDAVGRFLSPDPFVQMPDNAQNFNRYSYCLNNPLIYTDPSGEFIFTALSAIFCPALLPIAIGADVGALSGGIRASITGERSFWGGAWRGAVVGAIGGAFSMAGGGTFLANVAYGAGEGAFTGLLNAAMWGDDPGRSMLWGAASGAVFASVTSGIESIKNASEGYGFGTNIGRFDKMVVNGHYQDALDFFSKRFNGPQMTVGETGAWIDLSNGEISIGKDIFREGPQAVRVAAAHEWGHYYKDIISEIVDSDPSYKGVNYQLSMRPADHVKPITNKIGDVSMSGYVNAMKNSGKYHIGLKWMKGGTKLYNISGGYYMYRYFRYMEPHWHSFSGNKWYYLIPRRF